MHTYKGHKQTTAHGHEETTDIRKAETDYTILFKTAVSV